MAAAARAQTVDVASLDVPQVRRHKLMC